MSIFKTRLRHRTAEQLQAEHGDRRRAAASRAVDQLRDPMTAVVLHSLR